MGVWEKELFLFSRVLQASVMGAGQPWGPWIPRDGKEEGSNFPKEFHNVHSRDVSF